MKLLELCRTKPSAPERDRVRLIVVENGARGLETPVILDAADETIVVAQAADELPASLTIRVASRIVALERSRRRVGQALLLIGPRCDSQAKGARWLIARAALSHLLMSGAGELVLDADGAEPTLRHELVGLVEALLEESEPGNVPIRLNFRRDPPRTTRPSGINVIAASTMRAPLRSTGSESS